MTKLKVWSSAAGIIGLLFLVASVVGAVFQFIFFYLPAFQFGGFYTPQLELIFFILSIAAMAMLGILLIVSIFGIPRVLWIILAFLGLGCALAPPIVTVIGIGLFPYVFGPWYLLLPLDFIGFWLAAGGALLAMIFGFFIEAD
jgi:hypothetical protein